MDDEFRARTRERALDLVPLRDGALHDLDVFSERVGRVAPRGREVVDRDDRVPGGGEALAEMRADEARAARDQDVHPPKSVASTEAGPTGCRRYASPA